MAIQIPPSQQWSGNDGPWSTFPVRIGSIPDTVFLLPSSSSRQFLVVVDEGCDSDLYGIQDSSCSSKRGDTFNYNNSASFSRLRGNDNQEFYQIPFEAEAALNPLLPGNLSYGPNGFAGIDTVTFGYTGNDPPPLQQQLIAGVADPSAFIGLLPLAPGNATPTTYSATQPGALEALYESGQIRSRSWSYNAGAQWRNAFGSLTFGGYDSQRGNVENVVSIPIAQSTSRDLEVAIRAIRLDTNTNRDTAANGEITAFIDSTVPEIWLPRQSCITFEGSFGLEWDDEARYYFVNDTLHDSLTASNASVTFEIAANSSTDVTTAIRIPYASFNLSLSYPLGGINDSTTTRRYFPLRRADNATQHYLGRAFLQEAYLSVDYNSNTFNLSQATFNPTSELVVLDPSAANVAPTPNPDSSSSSSSSNSSLSGGAIAGIVVGVLAGVLIALGLAWWLWRKRRQEKSIKQWAYHVGKPHSSVTGTTYADTEDMDQQQHTPPYMYRDATSTPPVEVIEPAEADDHVKPELDAFFTARQPRTNSTDHRHELSALQSTRRTSRFSEHSKTSASASEINNLHNNPHNNPRNTVSPVFSQSPSNYTPGHSSPNLGESPPTGAGIWPGFGPVELHGHSRDVSRDNASEKDGPDPPAATGQQS